MQRTCSFKQYLIKRVSASKSDVILFQEIRDRGTARAPGVHRAKSVLSRIGSPDQFFTLSGIRREDSDDSSDQNLLVGLLISLAHVLIDCQQLRFLDRPKRRSS